MSLAPPLSPWGSTIVLGSPKEVARLGAEMLTQGKDITDANQTILLSEGARHVCQEGTLTANRVIVIGKTDSPDTDEMIGIVRFDTSAFTLTINDDAGTLIYVMPASQRKAVYCKYDGTHYGTPAIARIQ